MIATEPLCDLPTAFWPCEYRIKRADGDWELAAARRLRRTVFCLEQGVFAGDDADEIDRHAQTLVALSCVGGMNEQVVGTVRLHAGVDGEGDVWWGSRLAVHAAFRRQGLLGTALIRLAVGTARARGCQVFLAHVQQQNQRLFEKLHWRALRSQSLHGRAHVLMQADLPHYPVCHDPLTGWVVRARSGE